MSKIPQTNIRFPEDVKEYLQAQAEKHGRTLNAEVLLRIKSTMEWDEYFQNGSGVTGSSFSDALEIMKSASSDSNKDLIHLKGIDPNEQTEKIWQILKRLEAVEERLKCIE